MNRFSAELAAHIKERCSQRAITAVPCCLIQALYMQLKNDYSKI
jgi:hypothetical protein